MTSTAATTTTTSVILGLENWSEFKDHLSLTKAHVTAFDFINLKERLTPYPEITDNLNGFPRFQTEGEGRNAKLTEPGL